MSEYWNKDEDGFDSVPDNITEPEPVNEIGDLPREEVIYGSTGVENDMGSDAVSGDEDAHKAAEPEFTDSTYHWVNPKLQNQREEKQQNTWQSEPYAEPKQEHTYESYQFSQAESNEAKKKKSKEKKASGGLGKKFAVCAALAVVFGLVAGITFQGVNAIGNQINGTTEQKQVEIPSTETTADAAVADTTSADITPAAQTTASAGNYSVADVAANAMPSVVSISNLNIQEIQSFFGIEQYESESSGSGIIVGQNDEELLVATNNHVVSGAKTITVTFIDETSVEAQIKGTDTDNDLAVVAVKISDISEETLSQIKVATIGSSDDLVVGEQVVAIGNALGYGQSVTSGYVSALNREVTVDNVTANLIQTDAAINPGNSGGALLNMKGELIGINAVKFASSEVEGMGYAIPISTAEPILGDLMTRETRLQVADDKSSYLGISCREVTSESAQMYDLPSGVYVASVTEGSAAEKAGMKKGDIITSFDGTAISTYDELKATLKYYEAGETVDLVIKRAENGEYKEQTITITLDAKPADAETQQQQQQDNGNSQWNQEMPNGAQQ